MTERDHDPFVGFDNSTVLAANLISAAAYAEADQSVRMSANEEIIAEHYPVRALNAREQA